MLFLLTSRTRPDLTPAQFGELAALAKSFYASIPANVSIRGEWAALDRSTNYSLLEATDIAVVRAMQSPFAPFTETAIVPVTQIKGWIAT